MEIIQQQPTPTTTMFKIDLIVWKYLTIHIQNHPKKEFKIDLIVWKCGSMAHGSWNGVRLK